MPKSTAPKRRRSPPKTSALEKSALRIMRKLHEATGGKPQRWESLDNLGAVKADAASIAYAIERDWLIISKLVSLCLPMCLCIAVGYRLFFAASFSSSTLSSMSAMSRVRQQVAFDLLVVRLGHLVV